MRSVFIYSRLILLAMFFPPCIWNIYQSKSFCTRPFILSNIKSPIWWAKQNRGLLSATANRQRWESLVDELGEGPWDSFLFTPVIFYRLENLAGLGLHSNIWVQVGVSWVCPSTSACCLATWSLEWFSAKFKSSSRERILLNQESSACA